MDGDAAPLQVEAIDWAVRLAVGPVSEADGRAFAQWRALSPAHAQAFDTASQFCADLRAALPSQRADNVVPLRRPAPALSRRAFLGGGSAIAASLAGGLMVMHPPLGLWPSLAELMADERTGAGERRAFSPIAGVDVEMNSRSSVSTTDGGKGLSLIAGEVYVAVAGAAMPFRVAAGDGTVTAQAASFNVRATDGELCITCVGGTLAVTHTSGPIRIGAGEEVRYADDGRVDRSPADREAALAWRRGLLIFRGTPLSTAISQINRYFPGRLVLTDGTKGSRPVSGVFHVNQIELAVVQIQQLLDVRATHLPGGVVLIG